MKFNYLGRANYLDQIKRVKESTKHQKEIQKQREMEMADGRIVSARATNYDYDVVKRQHRIDLDFRFARIPRSHEDTEDVLVGAYGDVIRETMTAYLQRSAVDLSTVTGAARRILVRHRTNMKEDQMRIAKGEAVEAGLGLGPGAGKLS